MGNIPHFLKLVLLGEMLQNVKNKEKVNYIWYSLKILSQYIINETLKQDDRL